MLHLNGGNGGNAPHEGGFRDWMKYGTTVTANRDLMYMGIKNNLGLDTTEAVICWSDNNSNVYGIDNLVFKFTSGYYPSIPDARNSLDGLEVARFAPDGNVGIGDFSDNGYGLNIQPTRKLDVDGMVRIRKVIDSPNPSALIVGRELNNDEDYELQHIAFSGEDDEFLNGEGEWVIVNGANNGDCDWAHDPNTFNIVAAADIPNSWTGECTEPGFGQVVIGALDPKEAKLHVFDDNTGTVNTGITIGIYGGMNKHNEMTPGIPIFGVVGESYSPLGKNNIGGKFDGRNGSNYNIGVMALSSSDTQNNWGLSADNIGMYCEAFGSNNNNWGAYIVGGTFNTNTPINLSDESIKQDIADIENATEIINQLSPKTYHFRNEDYPQLGLRNGLEYGLIAQELEEVLPSLVKDVNFPAKYNEEGEMIAEAIPLKGVSYNDLIPILIQASKEQNAMLEARNVEIEELREELNEVVEMQASYDQIRSNEMDENLTQMQAQILELHEMLSQCCEANGQSLPTGNDEGNQINYELYQNAPNPFDTYTDISWKMAEEAHATIIVQNMQGQALLTLVDRVSSEGLHKVRWETSGLSQGTYFYSLIVNNELLVKRAIKIKN